LTYIKAVKAKNVPMGINNSNANNKYFWYIKNIYRNWIKRIIFI